MTSLILTDPHGGARRLAGFRYFWLKTVHGFHPSRHCARCLLGNYHPQVGATMECGRPVYLEGEPGALYYLCGVERALRWDRNFHLAFQVAPASQVEAETWNGFHVTIQGAKAIPFTDHAARQLFPEKSEHFLRCRNFQFGAQHFLWK